MFAAARTLAVARNAAALAIGMATLWRIFYLAGVWYLTKPAVKALFVPAVRSETDAPGDPQWS